MEWVQVSKSPEMWRKADREILGYHPGSNEPYWVASDGTVKFGMHGQRTAASSKEEFLEQVKRGMWRFKPKSVAVMSKDFNKRTHFGNLSPGQKFKLELNQAGSTGEHLG